MLLPDTLMFTPAKGDTLTLMEQKCIEILRDAQGHRSQSQEHMSSRVTETIIVQQVLSQSKKNTKVNRQIRDDGVGDIQTDQERKRKRRE